MSRVLVDSNVLIDTFLSGSDWYAWSAAQLHELSLTSTLVINPLIYAEVSVPFPHPDELERRLPRAVFRREPLPWEAGFLAGKAFARYRRAGGTRRSPLPDFYIGAHATVKRMRLLTRDGRLYREYFPGLDVIAP
jgi:predicted nucleic acid-binding protein